MKLLQLYRNQVHQCVMGERNEDIKDLSYYRDYLFFIVVLYAFPLSLFAVVPGIYISIIFDALPMAWIDFYAWFMLGLLAMLPGIPIKLRKHILLISFYIISVALLYYVGAAGPGLMYLLGINVLCSLILSARAGWNAVLISFLILSEFGFNIHFSWIEMEITKDQTVLTWTGIGVNLIFLSVVLLACLNLLLLGLQKSFASEWVLRKKVGEERQKISEANQLLEHKNQELQDLNYIIAHDLFEPLRSMQAFSNLLIEKYAIQLKGEAENWLQHIQEGSQRMSKMIRSLLEHSRLGLEKRTSKIDVNILIDEVILDLQQLVNEHQAFIHYKDLPTIIGHPIEVKQLFQNLISNGIKFHQPGIAPEITLEAKDQGDHFEFAVKDNGIGIAAKHFNKIFILFKQVHGKSKKGTGIGLANCKKIVENHKGQIWVESEENEGSIFIFTWPK